jgi:bacterioferritin (cytochrome b1)
MSDTPRTYAAAMPIDRIDTIASRPCNVVHEDVCRQLERELAEVTKQRDHYKAACDQYSEDEMLCKLQEVTEQRDALAEALRIIASDGEDQFQWSATKAITLACEALAATKGESHE